MITEEMLQSIEAEITNIEGSLPPTDKIPRAGRDEGGGVPRLCADNGADGGAACMVALPPRHGGGHRPALPQPHLGLSLYPDAP